MAEQQKIEFVLQANIKQLKEDLQSAQGSFKEMAKALKDSVSDLDRIKGPVEGLNESRKAGEKLLKILDQISKRKAGATPLDTKKLNAGLLEYEESLKKAKKSAASDDGETFVGRGIAELKEFRALLQKTKEEFREAKEELATAAVTNQPLESEIFKQSSTVEQQNRALRAKAMTERQVSDKAFFRIQLENLQKLSLEEKKAYVERHRLDEVYTKSVTEARRQIAEEIKNTEKQQTVGIIAQRYALYDVANGLNQASRQLTNFTKAAFLAQLEQERSFSQVEKTLVDLAEVAPEAVRKLKQELILLTTEIPKSFDEISKIAAIGSQMGIAAEALGKFTEVVAKFTATTGVSIEQTSLAFGRMANLLPDIDSSRFDELGSSIAFVGVKSVATEGEIISVGRQISAIAASAGFTADEVVGLSSAIASLGLAPEESRGALVRTLGEIRRSISSGSERLQQFASISNMTVDEFVDSWGRDAGGTFQRFIKGLSTVDIVKALQSVGLETIRTTRFLTSLGDNYELVFKQMALASEGMSNNYLDKTFATTVDDIIVRIELLGQSFQNLLASSTSSEPILQIIGGVVDGLKEMVVAMTELNKNPISAGISTAAILLVGLAGVLIGVVGAAALLRATFLALKTTIVGLAGTAGLPIWASQVIARLGGVTAAAGTATVATKGLTIAMTAMKIAVPALLAISLIAGVVAGELGKAEKQAEKTRKAFANFEGIEDALKKDTEGAKSAVLTQKMYIVKTEEMTDSQKKAIQEGKNLSTVFKNLKDDSEDAASSSATSALFYGEATAEFIKARIGNSEEFKKIIGRDDFAAYWSAIGADIDVFTQDIIIQGEDGIKRYFAALEAEAKNSGKIIPKLGADFKWDGLLPSGFLKKQRTVLDDFISLVAPVDKELQSIANSNQVLSGSADDAARDLRMMTDELIKLALASAGISEESLVAEDALFALGKTLTENGEDFDEFSEKGRQNIRAVSSVISALAKDSKEDLVTFAQNVEGLIASLTEQGYGGSVAVQMLRDSIAELTDDAGNPIEFDINFKLNVQAFMEGIKKAEEGTKGSAGRVQTALEKMVDRIQKAFQLLNRKIDANDALESLSESLIENGRNFSIYSKQGRDNLQSVQDAIDSLAQRSDGNTRKFGQDLDALRRVLQNSGFRGSAAIKLINQAMKAAGTGAKATTKQVKQMAKELNGLNADRLLSIAKAADSMASRLSDLFNASIQGQRANLALAAGYEKLEEDVANARKEIEDTQRTIKGLVADRGILEYQLQIALKYGDTLRAEEIRAELDKINASITENQNKINQAEATLTGTSATAQLDRLDTLQTLAQNINVAFANLAVQGDMTRKELRAWVDEQTEMFVKSAIAAGASEEDAKKLADQIKKNLYDAIKKTPKLKVKTDGANKAVNALKANINSLKDKTVTVTTVNRTINQAAMNPGMSIPQPGWQNFYSTGGFVSGPGSSTSDSIAARLSNGEYVVRASAVKHYGVDFMNALNSQAFQQRSFSSSTPQASLGEQLVYLSPEDRNLLRQAIDRPINLYTENTMIAKSANTGNVILAQRGQA